MDEQDYLRAIDECAESMLDPETLRLVRAEAEAHQVVMDAHQREVAVVAARVAARSIPIGQAYERSFRALLATLDGSDQRTC